MSRVDSFPSTTSPAGDVPLAPSDANLVQEMKNEIRTLVQEIALLAQADVSEDEFFAGLVTRVISAMAAVGGAVWTVQDNRFTLAYQANLAQAGLRGSDVEGRRHLQLLGKAASSQQALVVPPQAGAAADEEGANPSDHLLVLAPVVFEGQVAAVLEVFQRPGGGPTTQRGYLRFVVQMAELVADFFKNRHLRLLQERQGLWQELEKFLKEIHRSLDLRQTSYAVVNEGRRILGCDRVSLALVDGRRVRIEAISGLDSIERRAAQVQRLQDLARAVLKTKQSFWHAAAGDDAPPQIEQPLERYVDLSHARMVGVLPLFAPTAEKRGADERDASAGRVVGALIVEQLHDERASETLHSRAAIVAEHTAAALSNASAHSNLFLLPLWKALGRLSGLARGGALVRTLLVAALLAGGAAALAIVPKDFEVGAKGKLQPVERREVFAGIDGIVTQVPVQHGDRVQTGDLLAQLSNTDLELQLDGILGRQTTNQEQIAALQRALLDNSAGGARMQPGEENRLAGQLMELRQEAENLQRELQLFRAKQRELTVVAQEPGQIVTWKVDELLLRRPVQRGQVLMTVANPDGPWELELYVPERRMKHLMNAIQLPVNEGDRPPLDVVFMLSSHPGAEFHGHVVEIEQTAEVRGEEGNTVLVRVAIDKRELPPLHDQVTVTARLYCGQTSIGYAWFCDLIEAVQSRVLFWL
jgi:hypothetical protein